MRGYALRGGGAACARQNQCAKFGGSAGIGESQPRIVGARIVIGIAFREPVLEACAEWRMAQVDRLRAGQPRWQMYVTMQVAECVVQQQAEADHPARS